MAGTNASKPAWSATSGQSPIGAPASSGAPSYGTTGGTAASNPTKKRGRGAIVVLSLLLPLGIIGGLIGGYALATNVNSFDNKAVEDAVAGVLRDEYGFSDLASVDCPNWIKVDQGESFQCEFEYAGGTQTVTVTQGSQSGQLVVGAPE